MASKRRKSCHIDLGELEYPEFLMSADQFFKDAVPNELLYFIVDGFSPLDLTAFSCLCRRMRLFCLPLAIQRSGISIYNPDSISVSGTRDPRNTPSGFSALPSIRLAGNHKYLRNLSYNICGEEPRLDLKEACRFCSTLEGLEAFRLSLCFESYRGSVDTITYLPALLTVVSRLKVRTLDIHSTHWSFGAWSANHTHNEETFSAVMRNAKPMTHLEDVSLTMWGFNLVMASPSFRDWILQSLVYSPIKKLAIHGDDEHIPDMFGDVTLPLLETLDIPCRNLPHTFIAPFIARHTQLRKLDLDSSRFIPPDVKTLPLPSEPSTPILQHLSRLTASPDYMYLILNSIPHTTPALTSVELQLPSDNLSPTRTTIEIDPASLCRAFHQISLRRSIYHFHLSFNDRLFGHTPTRVKEWFSDYNKAFAFAKRRDTRARKKELDDLLGDRPVLENITDFTYHSLHRDYLLVQHVPSWMAKALPNLRHFSVSGLDGDETRENLREEIKNTCKDPEFTIRFIW